jgi:hypothetical protein
MLPAGEKISNGCPDGLHGQQRLIGVDSLDDSTLPPVSQHSSTTLATERTNDTNNDTPYSRHPILLAQG